MKLDIRAATPQERLYLEEQSSQLKGQTGYIGVLNGGFGEQEDIFTTEWNDGIPTYRGENFDEDFDSMVNALRSDDVNGGVLEGRNAARLFCKEHQEAAFQGENGKEYAFRIDHREKAYLLRLAPLMAGQNFQIRCYVQKWLDGHIENAKRGIHFITPDYKELFRIPDGDFIRLLDGRESTDFRCRYIDEAHLELRRGKSTSLYHICELAEKVERAGKTVIPLRSSLPDICYGTLAQTGELIVICKGEKGYRLADAQTGNIQKAQALADRYNEAMGVSKAQAAAMQAGAMFGWDVPAADPKLYDKDGILRRPRQRSMAGIER